MKAFFKLKNLTALLFLAFLLAFFALSLRPFLREGYYTLKNGGGPAELESAYNAQLPLRTAWITLNGGCERLLGRRELNERYRLDNGQLTYIIPETDMTGLAENTFAFKRALEERGIPLLYINTPFKIDEADKQLPVGVEDFSNENADRFLALIRSAGVDALDLRENERAQGLEHYSLFYPTDHHWTAETGLWAAGQIAAALRDRDPSLAADPDLFDPANYSLEIKKHLFLGSHGRRVGPWYAGMDDLSVISPRFDTALRFSVPSEGLVREGRFEDTLLFPEKLSEGKLLETSRYNVYCGGEYDRMRIENLGGGNGKRLLILKDSFSLVVAPYLSMGFECVDWVDLRLYQGSLTELIAETSPDMVIILYNPGALEGNNTVMFDFLPRSG